MCSTLKTVVVLVAVLIAWGVDGSELKLRNVYSDKMLFQRDQPVVFAGTGDAGATVTVKMNGAAGAAKADAAGGWRVELPPMKAGGPYEVAVTDGKTSLVLRDVLVGELWLASGQSNMEMPVWSKDPYYRLTNGLEVAAAANDPELRFLKVERKISYDGPQSELPGKPHWARGDEPESVKPLSATGYMFARELRRRLKVPVGIIDASWGGTLIEPWIPESVLRKRGFVRDIGLLEFSRNPRRDNCPAWLFEMQKKHLDLVADWIAAVEKANAAVSQEAKANWMKPELKEDAWKSAPVTFDKPALAWFRWHVEIPVGAEDVRFEAQSVCDTDEVWFDGRKIGATDVYDPYYWKVKRRYPVGKVVAGKHVLAMRLFSHCGNSGAKGLKLVWKGGSVDLDAEMPLRRVEATPTKETGARPGYPWELGNWRIVALPDGSNIVPSSIHNAMVAPLDVFRCRGTVWYQGCSNANEWPQHPEGVGSYHGYQKALVEALRGLFARDDMAFVCVQLASFLEQTPAKRMKDAAVAAMPPSEGGYVKIRDEQTRIREVPLCDCVTAVDIGDHSDIHPKNKQEVGRRLAGAAEVLCYGGKEKTRGPEVVKTVWKDGAAEITFDEPLVLKDGKIGDHEFTFVDAAGQVAWAKGVQIAPNAVRVTCDAIRNPAHVDYCRVPFVFASSLFNRDGYPALPFAKLAVAAPMTVTLTFDDGVKGHIRYAAPIIEKYGYRGTFNIVTDWIGQDKKLSWDEVRELRRRGHEIACHTKTHRSLTDLLSVGKTNEVVRELAESREVLKREVGVSPRFLCHPFVHASPAVDALVRAEGMEPYACNRFNVGGDVSPAAFAKALDEWIAHGVRSKDILFHGITAETGGWKPFASERDFEACVAEISRREKAGQLRVVSYAEFRSERDRSHPLPTSSWPSAACGTSYDNKLPIAALLGNGTLGAVNGGDADCKLFVLTRGDLWSYGDGTNGKKPENIRPMSFADFEIRPGVKTVASEDTLVAEMATLKTLGRFGRGNVALESFVVADEDVFVVTGQTTTDDIWAISLKAHDTLTIFPRTSGVDDGSPWVRRSTVNLASNDPHGWTTNATAALRVIGATIADAKADGKGFASATVRIKAGMPFALVISSDSRRRFSSEDVATLRKRHIAAWTDWWSSSRIEIDGDPELERWYYGQLYLLRSAVRRGAFPPGLYGPWVTTDTPAWHNDFHLNYNYVATYYGAFAANRCEIAESMPDPLLAYLPQARRNAQEALQSLDGCDGKKYANSRAYLNVRTDLANGITNAALFPVALGPWGVSAEGDLKHWGQISDGVFQCALMCTHWEYTLDHAYLKKVWPLWEATANFFRTWCEKEALPDGGYRYNVWDSHWEGSGLVKNSAPALGCAKHLFETLVAVTPVLRELGIRVSDADAAAWKDFAEHLSPLATGTAEVGGRAVRTLSGVEREDGKADLAVGNTITFESVIPGENFSFDVTDAFRARATNAVAAILERGGKSNFTCANQTPKFYATAIRTGYPCAPILAAFKEHEIRPRLQKNFHLRDGVHGVEKIGSIELIQSMLIQCDHGIVKVFPNWNGTNARFARLRTKGAFLVSSEMRDGRVTAVTVTSEKGGRFRLVDPFGGTFVPAGWTRGRTRLSGEPTLERDFAPGETRFEIDPKTGRLDSEQSEQFRPCAELAVWDFDGTILDGDCTEGLVRDGETVYAGLLADCIAAGFARDYRGADGVTRFRRDYEAKIAAGRKLEAYRDCARIFAGANVAELEAFCRRRFRETIEQHLFTYSLRRFRELEASGVENHVVSASADFFVQAAAEVLRVPRARVHGILVKIRDGKLTDEIIEPFPYGDGKTAVLRELERTRGGKVRYGFGNSYSTDGPFLKAIAEQGGTATMFNGGKIVKGMTELFVCTNLTETVGAPKNSSPVPISENSRPQPFVDGDTVVFLGDSITHIANWTKLVMRRYLEVYPERTIRFRNAGVGGDSSWACTNRLDEDVFRHKPSVIVTMFGMNDAQGAKWAETFGPAEETALTNCLANYRRHIALLADKLKAGAPGARLVWCTPSPYDDAAKLDTPNSPGKGRRFLAGVAEIVRDFGRARGEDVIDFNGPMRAFAATRQQDDPTFTLIGPDRTHPGAAGSFFMACQFLRQQGVDPNVIDPLVPWPETALSRQLEKRIACEAVVRDVMLERWYLKWTIGTADDLTAVRAFADKIKSEGQKGFYEDRVPFYLKTWTPTFLADREAELQRMDADLQRAALRAEEMGAIRPGGVDGSPFWNRYGRMFMYPPAFDFKPVAGAVKYRFLIHDREHQCLTHEADRPTAPLTPVWSQLPNGFVAVWCQAVLTNGQTVVTRGDWGTDYRMFWKQAPFKPGTYSKPPRSYGEAAEKFLTWIFDGNATAFRHFSETGDPHGDWPVGIPINCYPAKIHSALIRAGLDFAVRCPVRREEAMKLVRAAAEYLQKVSCKPGEPCAGFPPTYEGNSRVCTAYAGQIMMIYPADAGRAYLALAKATGERRWADAARLIGETYLKLQEADGTWPLKVWAKTGKASLANRLQPLAVVDFLEQLFAATGDRRYRDAADRAFAWVERGPMKTWNWEAQYEDAEPSPVPYYNMAGIVACQAVEHVLKRYPGDKNRLAFCREAMRFVEDQFVCWEVPCDANGFGACTLDKLPTNPPYEYRSWTVPCVLEQSTYAVPVSAAAGIVIGAYLSMHAATGDPMDLQRAQAIGDALVCAQRDNGAIPDVIATPYYQCWLNDAYTAVEGLRRLAGRAVPLAGK